MKQVVFLIMCLLSLLVAEPGRAKADCNDSYSKTQDSITINWDVAGCHNLKSSGDIFEVCWKGGTMVFTACLTHSQRFQQQNSSFTINGLTPSATYGVKTKWRGKAIWHTLSERVISTDAPPSGPVLTYGVATAGCRTFIWSGLSALPSGSYRKLWFDVKFLNLGGPFVYDKQVDITPLGSSGSMQVCNLKPGAKHRASVVDIAVGQGTGVPITPPGYVIFM